MQEHPFAKFIRMLGKGKNGARSLSYDEAHEAMSMIYCYDTEPEQVAAFLMLLRVKEESAEEVAGFVRAIRESIPPVSQAGSVAIDWPTYAGKRRHMPWYLLAAILLSRNGYPVFMHGVMRKDERIYTESVLKVLGIRPCKSLNESAAYIADTNFAYMGIDYLSPTSADLLDMRNLLGLRSPLHTVVRMINPLAARLSMHSVFHPNYAEIHQQASLIIGDQQTVSFKGEGGENERIPERAATVFSVKNGESSVHEWPALLPAGRYNDRVFPDTDHFLQVWYGEIYDNYAEKAVIGTMAIALHALNDEMSQEDALKISEDIWHARNDSHVISNIQSNARV